jgi:hypothetical protein
MVLVSGALHAGEMPHLSEQCPHAVAWLQTNHERLETKKRELQAIHPSNPALATHLAQRYGRDQAAEEAAAQDHGLGKSTSEARKHLLAIQTENLAWLKPIIAVHGFPTVRQVGVKGVEHAWMLVQHADMDPEFQADVLAQLKSQLVAEPFLREEYALLTDRVRRAQKKPQIYGTQFTFKDGRLIMQPTEGVSQLDERRASMNLMPVSDYRCVLAVMYHIQSGPGMHRQRPAR